MLLGPRHRGLTTMWRLFTCPLNCELRREYGVYGTLCKAYTYPVPYQAGIQAVIMNAAPRNGEWFVFVNTFARTLMTS